MNEIFNFNGQKVRTLTINNEPYFVGKDVADVLGYERPTKAIQDHIDDEDKDVVPIQDSIGRKQNTPIINESGVYDLIFVAAKQSTNPEIKEKAQKFKRWVTSEVLPQIRKQGAYVPENLSDEAFIALFTGQKKLKQKQLELAQDVDYLKNEQPIHPSFAQALLKKRKARVVMWLGGMDSPAYGDKVFAQSVFREAEMDFKAHFNVSRYDMLPKKFEDAALAYWMTWEPSTNTKMQIYALNSTEKA
ncbi:TPA: ORF6C domain-containing protein [Streptococcus pyogenes]|uniref:ORF6C domain-containing protein n=1 Tax=Streptococcus canis TaxID=1329 RepID=A0AAE4TS89_STRCB|nr:MULTISPECIES: ORF6C domain-containing protein [Streptococcus]HEP4089037.1 ORF6C domain-containing protein [Streptococcus pyogenes]MDV5976727.1 ORF6C domain-containing protein [Streptococcus canis]MDY2964089.1 ORF6C domain-containing protein [Streptococcus dysgalactiae]MDY4033750.1 ORF6C domain-containing protein [Streptococcus dysgalactiae]VTT08950.1 phage associated antirepressor [Streptococcus dysgalactiae]